MFAIEALLAGRGDCLLLEYGDPDHPHRVLIDGGPKLCYPALRERILAMPEGSRSFDLFVVTHIDADHIEGVLRLLDERDALGVRFGDIWFNGLRHLPAPVSALAPMQGEQLTDLLEVGCLPWNRAFGGDAVVVPDTGNLPSHTLAGGMRLTLLSPLRESLIRLWPKWHEAVEGAGLARDGAEGRPEQETTTGYQVLGTDIAALAALPFQRDRSEANGSSIAFLAEFEGRRCLLTGDALPCTLAAGVRRLLADDASRLPIDVFKLSHHGSRGSLSVELLGLLQCSRYLISTDGSYFRHPHSEAIARIVLNRGERPCLCFNYRSQQNSEWDNPDWIGEYKYEVTYPTPEGQPGIRLDV